jgi:hypothetical protein
MVVLHLIIVGIIVGSMVQFKMIDQIASLGTFFFIGCLALQNTIRRMLDERG